MRSLSLLTLLALAAAPGALAQETSEGSFYELHYRVSAQARSARLDADLEAGGRLLMRGRRTDSGYLHLSLERPIVAPWKLYWVDPAGPFGDEVKLASVSTLESGSWETLAEARAHSERFAEERYAEWRAGERRKPPLDGAFTFIVIGPAPGRFTASFDAEGALTAVRNRLTDRWLSGPFDQYAGGWGPDAAPGAMAPEGYWFWNKGESAPFAYEPHTYHAFESALRFLSLPMDPMQTTPDGEDLVPRRAWPDLAAMAIEVVETLAPRARGLFGRGVGAVPVTLEGEEANEQAATRRARASTPEGALSAEREVETPTADTAAADRFSLSWRQERAAIEIEVGYAAAPAS
jgi:hypothetical protein